MKHWLITNGAAPRRSLMSKADHIASDDGTSLRRVAIVGSVGVGKTSLWELLCPDANGGRGLKLPQTTVSVPVGTARSGLLQDPSRDVTVLDTPGIYSLFTQNEDERVARQLLLTLGVDSLLIVLDAKNLRRSLMLALQFAEFGLPMAAVLNMIDEAEVRGVEISVRALRRHLGLPVVATVARERLGTEEVPPLLEPSTAPTPQVSFPEPVERVIEQIADLVPNPRMPARALAILLTGGSEDARAYAVRQFGVGVVSEVDRLLEQLQKRYGRPLDVVLTESYSATANELVDRVQRVSRRSPPLLVRFGQWAQRPATGLPIAAALLVAMYYWVGVFGATWLVDLLNAELFGKHLIPALVRLAELIPWEPVRAALVDPDFGVLTTGLFLAFGIVLPVLFCFYLFFGVLEESGYLPRMSVLVNRLLQQVGLSGKGVMPLTMGLSCVTMAILTTRMLDTRRERLLATFLLTLGMPCAPLVGVMMVVLGPMPWYTTAFLFGALFVQTLVAGLLAARLVPGAQPEFMMELPPMRVPKPVPILRRTWLRTYLFMKEAVPLFLFASLLVFLFARVGGLQALADLTRPLMSGLLGLPDESVRVFMKTIVRREAGAVELDLLRPAFSNLQLVITLLVMTLLIPCMNTVIVILKEQGLRLGLGLLATVFVYALVAGGIVHHVCRLLGITFQ